MPREDVLIGAYFLLAVIAPKLLPSKLLSGNSTITYSPTYDISGSTKGPSGLSETTVNQCLGRRVMLCGRRQR